MKNEIKEYLESAETGFYESNYGTDKDPCIYYHFQKIDSETGNSVDFSDILIPVRDSVGLFSFVENKDQEFSKFTDSLNQIDGYAILERVDQIKELEAFIMKLTKS